MYRKPTNAYEFYDIFISIICENVINKITSQN